MDNIQNLFEAILWLGMAVFVGTLGYAGINWLAPIDANFTAVCYGLQVFAILITLYTLWGIYLLWRDTDY